MSWCTVDPLSPKNQVLNPKFSHRNPVYKLMTETIKREISQAINTMNLKWRVDVEVEFTGSDGKPYYRASQLVMRGVLGQCDGHYQKAVEEIFSESNMDQYELTRITVEIIGNTGIKDTDFTMEAAG